MARMLSLVGGLALLRACCAQEGYFLRSLQGDGQAAEVAQNGTNRSSTGGFCEGERTWQPHLHDNMFKCGMRHASSTDGMTRCVTKSQQVSEKCGACLGELIHCGFKCTLQCCFGKCQGSKRCRACNGRKCDPAFHSCSGFHTPYPCETDVPATCGAPPLRLSVWLLVISSVWAFSAGLLS